MSQGARDKAITRFADEAKVKVLLASLRCGGCKDFPAMVVGCRC